MRRRLVIGLAFVIGLTAAGCRSASGCDDFHPESAPLAVGQSTKVSLEVEDGAWTESLDVGGHYWSMDTVPVPPSSPSDGTLRGTATLVDESTVSVDFGKLGTARFAGPVGCD